MRILSLQEALPYEGCVATIGFFDGVHVGHCNLISRLSSYARVKDLASLLVTFDRHPREVMNQDYRPRLLTTFKERCELLSATEADYCVVLPFTRELADYSAERFMHEVLWERLRVRSLWVGYDHRFGHNRSEGFKEYESFGAALGMEVRRAPVYAPSGVCVSSSMVRVLLENGSVREASRWLGRGYELSGRVAHGYGVGRELGFPTANLIVEDGDKLVPCRGVYVVRVRGAGGAHVEYGGMLNVGCRPTLGAGGERSIEVHVFDFAGDLYGARLTVRFVERLRGEMKFDSAGELSGRLSLDERAARKVLEGYKRRGGKL